MHEFHKTHTMWTKSRKHDDPCNRSEVKAGGRVWRRRCYRKIGKKEPWIILHLYLHIYIVIEMLASKNLIMNGKHEEDLEYREASLLQWINESDYWRRWLSTAEQVWQESRLMTLVDDGWYRVFRWHYVPLFKVFCLPFLGRTVLAALDRYIVNWTVHHICVLSLWQ